MTTSTMNRIRRLAGYLLGIAVVLAAGLIPDAEAQFDRKWLSAGSYHNWYSAGGSECEECGFVRTQQDGMRWPGIYRFTDMQAAKALWIGATNVTDEFGTNYPFRVVHIGPRVTGVGEFFPTRFELVSREDPTFVTVDGIDTFPAAEMVVDRVDPSIPADRMIINETNTLLGVTMERRILQFSQEYHDNYHVIEYTFTNTGNTDDDPEIELPNQTLEGVYFYMHWRLAVAKETRFVIGNGTGWGLNTMNDARGDGVLSDPPDEQFRAQFSWHGNFPGFSAYDNVGGPIIPPLNADALAFISDADTLGRLGATQFAGVVTLHADVSASDETDDPGQPSTTNYFDSDATYTSNNDPFSPAKMETEYGVMSTGHQSPRHAWAVEPSGMPGWLEPSGNPAFNGASGGYSFANGYGPYTLAPGESVRIVVAEAASGLSREANTVLGQAFKDSGSDAGAPLTYNGSTMTKNEWVFTSRDSLFQTFRRAIANFESAYAIPQPPVAPSLFSVAGGGDRITLEWDIPAGSAPPNRFEIYRARGAVDSTYTLLHEAQPSERSYDDLTAIRGLDYYYYIVAVNDAASDGTGMTPAGVALRSSRYYTQTYDPVRLKRPAGTLAEVRVVPNPLNLSSPDNFRFTGALVPERLAFLNIPGQCTIDIYTEIGERIRTLQHTDGSGDEFWDLTTESTQVVVSGLYIAVITDTETGERTTTKFVIIR